MKNIVIFEKEKVDEVKSLCESLCGCADNVSYSSGDDETAEAIDLVESGILKILAEGKSIEVDEVMAVWIAKLCNKEIDTANSMIRQENLWALGSNTTEQSEIHVQNMVRLEQYKVLLESIKRAIVV